MNSTLSAAECLLSPRARALSTILTAFIGSIVTGTTNGYHMAYLTALVCWIASLRIVLVGLWGLHDVLCGQSPVGGRQFQDAVGRIPGLKLRLRGAQDPFAHGDTNTGGTTTWLGWCGWIWATVYSPIAQILWLMDNWQYDAGSLKLVRALGLSVVAVSLTIDTRARYSAALGHRIGRWAKVAFNFWTATSCFILGVGASIELILGVKEAKVPWFVIAIYVVAMFVWTVASFDFMTPHDEARGNRGGILILAGLAVGTLGGVLTATPAFMVLYYASDTPGLDLGAYLKCESVRLWQKVAVVVP